MFKDQKKIIKLTILILILTISKPTFSNTFSDITSSHTNTDITKETISCHDFVTFRENKNGILTEKWLIDGQEVSFSDYKATMAEMIKTQIEKKRQAALEEAEQLKQIKQKAAKRLIETATEKIRDEIKRIREYGLEQSLIWSPETIASAEEFNRIVKETSKSIDIDGIDKAQIYARQLESTATKINKLFFKTAEYIVSHTTDTKLLKKLMELL